MQPSGCTPGIAVRCLGYAAGVLTTGSCVPQIVRAIRTRSTGDLSYGMMGMVMVGSSMWAVYGALLVPVDVPLIVWDVVTILLYTGLAVVKHRTSSGLPPEAVEHAVLLRRGDPRDPREGVLGGGAPYAFNSEA